MGGGDAARCFQGVKLGGILGGQTSWFDESLTYYEHDILAKTSYINCHDRYQLLERRNSIENGHQFLVGTFLCKYVSLLRLGTSKQLSSTPSLSMQNMIIKLLRLSSFFIFILHQYSKYHLAFHKSSYPCHKNNFFSFPEDAYIPTINLTFRLTSINAHTREQIGKSSSDLPPVCVCVCAPVHSLLPQNVLPSRWLEPFLPIFSGKLLGYLFRSNKEGRKALGSRAVNSSAFINSRCIIINRHFEA